MKENSKVLKIVLVIISLICVGLVAYIVWDKTNAKEVKEPAKTSEPKKEDKLTELNKDDSLVQELYKYIPFSGGRFDKTLDTAYQDKVIKVTDLKNNLILATAFQNFDLSKGVEPSSTTPCSASSDGWCNFDESVMEEQIKKMYNLDSVNHGDIEVNYAVGCEYKNEVYVCSQGGGGVGTDAKRSILKANQDDNNLYIYDNYILYYPVYVNEELSSTIEYYQYSNKKGLIATTNRDDDDFYAENSTTLEKYKNSLKTFKHTFKKRTDGSYYYYQTEVE